MGGNFFTEQSSTSVQTTVAAMVEGAYSKGTTSSAVTGMSKANEAIKHARALEGIVKEFSGDASVGDFGVLAAMARVYMDSSTSTPTPLNGPFNDSYKLLWDEGRSVWKEYALTVRELLLPSTITSFTDGAGHYTLADLPRKGGKFKWPEAGDVSLPSVSAPALPEWDWDGVDGIEGDIGLSDYIHTDISAEAVAAPPALAGATAIEYDDIETGTIDSDGADVTPAAAPEEGILSAISETTTVPSPDPITVGDMVDPQVEARANLEMMQAQRSIGMMASDLFYSRQTMGTQADTGAALILADMARGVAEYDAELRQQQAAMEAGALQSTAAIQMEAQAATARNAMTAGRAYFDARRRVRQHYDSLALQIDQANAAAILNVAIANAGFTHQADLASVQAALNAAKMNRQTAVRAAASTALSNTDRKLHDMKVGFDAAVSTLQLARDATKATLAAHLRSATVNSRLNITALQIVADYLQAITDRSQMMVGLSETVLRQKVAVQAFIQHSADHHRALMQRMEASISKHYSQEEMRIREHSQAMQFELDRTRVDMALRTNVSAGITASQEQHWRAIMQDMIVLKEGLSAIGATPQGSIQTSSHFDNLAQGVSGLTALVSTGINLGLVLS